MSLTTCSALRSDGQPCRADFGLYSDGRCWHHTSDPDVREQRARARQRGGMETARRYTRKASTFDASELPPLDSLQAAQSWLEICGRKRAEGVLSHGDLSAFARIISEWVRAQGAKVAQEDVEALKARVAALEGVNKPRVVR